MYFKWDSGLMLVSETPQEGYKPVEYTEAPEAPSGYIAAFYWKEEIDKFVQTWEIVPEDDDIDDTEALAIMLGEEQ